MAGEEAGRVSLSGIFKGQQGHWEPLMTFKPESNMLKFTSLEDYPNCKIITTNKQTEKTERE